MFQPRGFPRRYRDICGCDPLINSCQEPAGDKPPGDTHQQKHIHEKQIQLDETLV